MLWPYGGWIERGKEIIVRRRKVSYWNYEWQRTLEALRLFNEYHYH